MGINSLLRSKFSNRLSCIKFGIRVISAQCVYAQRNAISCAGAIEDAVKNAGAFCRENSEALTVKCPTPPNLPAITGKL